MQVIGTLPRRTWQRWVATDGQSCARHQLPDDRCEKIHTTYFLHFISAAMMGQPRLSCRYALSLYLNKPTVDLHSPKASQ
eukprot:scaffold9570_cov71-Skeletonema_dohrnii-CCMP3373.AAC.2